MAAAVLLVVASYSVFSAQKVDVDVAAIDTFAGNSTILTASTSKANAPLVFEVISSSGESYRLPAFTDNDGFARVEFSGENTTRAGSYKLTAMVTGYSGSGETAFFSVLPSRFSDSFSTIEPRNQVINALEKEASLKVILRDEYNNPLDGHVVRLISSSGDDVARPSSNISDKKGEVSFVVTSSQPGAVTYSAYDVTADKVLSDKAKVVYFDDANYVFSNDLPQDYAFSAVGNSSGEVDYLEFEDVPSVIRPADPVSFSITAYDNLDQPVINYTGTVQFSVTQGNAQFVTLPSNYTFTTDDLGSHTFSISLQFQSEGSYVLRVNDVLNPEVFGEYTFDVVANGVPDDSPQLTVTNPITGTYSNNIQVISGLAPPGADIKIFDDDVEIASLLADIDGQFTVTTSPLADGVHNFYVAEVNDIGTIIETSEVVEVTIDTASPEISQVVFDPIGEVEAGSAVLAKAFVGDTLSSASLIVNDNIYDMQDSGQGFYQVNFPAPTEFGTYPVSFILVDDLGNESRVNDYTTLMVGGELIDHTVILVPDVTGLVAESDDKRVTLSWNPVSNAANPITNYRVYYGTSPNELADAVDTFTDSTTWYIPNLANGVEYYFAVVAIDDKGNTSEHFSNIVSAVPQPIVIEPEPINISEGLEGGEHLDHMESDVSDSGPELVWLIVLSFLGGIFYLQLSKGKIALNSKKSNDDWLDL